MQVRAFLVSALIAICLLTLTLKTAAAADARPKPRGTFTAWTTATYVRKGRRICYAFTRPVSPKPSKTRRDVVLMMAKHRRSPAVITLSGGHSYPHDASATVAIGHRNFPFFIFEHSAYARESAAALQALKRGVTAVATLKEPHRGSFRDKFSLKGFTVAYGLIEKLCPS